MTSPALPVSHPPVAVRPVVRPGLRRWAVALGVVALALGGTILAFSFAAGSATGTRLAGWAPAGTVAYAEVALDPPSGQADALATFLGNFPGFADRARLADKLDELGGRFVDAATHGKLAYADIKPWLGDTAAGALVTVPVGRATLPSSVSIVAVKDETALRAWLAAHLPEGSTTVTSGSTELTVGEVTGGTWAVGVLDGVLLAGERQAVEAAVATGGRSGFAEREPARTAFRSVGDASLGVAFVDLGAFAAAVPADLADALGRPVADLVPGWAVTALRVRDDALEAETTVPAPAALAELERDATGPTLPPRANRTSTLAERIPADALVALEGRDLGPTVAALGGRASTLLGDSTAGSGLTLLLGLAGNADALAGWLGDGALVVLPGDPHPDGGLVGRVSDADAAIATLRQLRALLGFAAGGAVTFEEASVEGVAVTTLVVEDPGALLRRLSSLGGTPRAMTSGDGPAWLDEKSAGMPLRLSWAVRDDLLVAGSSLDFVRAVLATDRAGSLAELERYRTAIERAGSSNSGQVWVDLPGVMALVLPSLPPEARTTYERELAPYLESLGGLAGASLAGDPMRVRFVVTVR